MSSKMSLDPAKANALTMTVYGKTGSGKSYLVHWIAKRYDELDLRDRIVVVSTTSMDRDEYLPNFNLLTVDERTPKSLNWGHVLMDHPRLYIEMMGLDEQNDHHLDRLSRTIRGMGNTLFVVDEAHQLFGRYTDAKGLKYLIRQGRKYKVEWVLASQQPVDVAKEGASQANILITFRTEDKNHVERLSRRMEVKGGQIRNLDDYEYFIHNAAEGKVEKETTDELEF